MGADIHIHVEIRKKGQWKPLKRKHFSGINWTGDGNPKKESSPFDWRHYRMFGILAGVRASIHPIKNPTYKLPEDCSVEVKKNYEVWEGDGHSASYLTARELVEFDFNQDLRNSDQEQPVNTRRVLLEKTIIESENFKDDELIYTYYDFIGGLDSMFFTHIKELAELGDLDDVRIVFWFDN